MGPWGVSGHDASPRGGGGGSAPSFGIPRKEDSRPIVDSGINGSD
jgi:hypothetical protein